MKWHECLRTCEHCNLPEPGRPLFIASVWLDHSSFELNPGMKDLEKPFCLLDATQWLLNGSFLGPPFEFVSFVFYDDDNRSGTEKGDLADRPTNDLAKEQEMGFRADQNRKITVAFYRNLLVNKTSTSTSTGRVLKRSSWNPKASDHRSSGPYFFQ